MPITRYAAYLKNHRQYDAYAELLETHFNFETVDGLMCRSTLSVGWDGRVYDCDFNQALGLALGNGTKACAPVTVTLASATSWPCTYRPPLFTMICPAIWVKPPEPRLI